MYLILSTGVHGVPVKKNVGPQIEQRKIYRCTAWIAMIRAPIGLVHVVALVNGIYNLHVFQKGFM